MSSDNPELEIKETAAVEPAATEDKQQRAERARVLLGQLAERYPACFHRDPKAVRPLAIGIQQKLRADLNADPAFADTPGWLLRQALAIYTRSGAYVRALVERRPRIALDGSTAGEVSDQEHAHALERQAEIDARRAARAPRRGKPQGRRPQEGHSQEARPQEGASQDGAPQENKPRGERPRGERPQGARPQGERRRRTNPAGGAPRGERPRERSQARPAPDQRPPEQLAEPPMSAEERTRLKLEALAKKFARE